MWVHLFPSGELQKSIRVRCGVQPGPGPHMGLSCSLLLLHPPATPMGKSDKPLEVGAGWEAGKGRASHTWHTRKLICKSALGTTSECSLWGRLCASPLSGLVLHQPGFLPGGKGAGKAFSQKSHHHCALAQHARLFQPNPSHPFSLYIFLIGQGGFLGLLF